MASRKYCFFSRDASSTDYGSHLFILVRKPYPDIDNHQVVNDVAGGGWYACMYAYMLITLSQSIKSRLILDWAVTDIEQEM